MNLEDLPDTIDSFDLFEYLHAKREEHKMLPTHHQVYTNIVNDLQARYSTNPKSVGSSKVTKSAEA